LTSATHTFAPRLSLLSLCSALVVLPLPAAAQQAGAAAPARPVEILDGSDAACETLRAELAARWQGHGFDEEPAWKDQDPDFTFPRELGDGQQADVDFYNDGKLSRVFLHYYDSPAMRGSSLLVQPGRAPERLELAASDPLEDPESWLIPCQLQGKRFPLSQCPPLSDRNDDTGLTVSWADHTRHVRFRSRYMDLALVRLNNTIFVVVTGTSPDTADFAAVLKPLPYRTFRTTCLLHRR
jgi:hypothetical protein